MISLLIVGMVVSIMLAMIFGPEINKGIRKATGKKAIGAPTSPKLSNPATLLLDEYNALPEESRPFPSITDLLVALDEKNSLDQDVLRSHFHHFNGWSWVTTFEPDSDSICRHRDKCKFKEYVDLHLSIKKVKDTLAEKVRAELESRHVATTQQLEELTASLNAEADHNREYVKQFKELA